MELERLASLFESVKVAPLRETDLLVCRTMAKLDLLAMAQLHEYIENATGHGRILILTDGADLALIRPEIEPAATVAPASADAPALLPNGQQKRSTVPGGIA